MAWAPVVVRFGGRGVTAPPPPFPGIIPVHYSSFPGLKKKATPLGHPKSIAKVFRVLHDIKFQFSCKFYYFYH